MINRDRAEQSESRPALRILFLEDNLDDVELSLRELKKACLEATTDVVTTKDQFVARLSCLSSYDVVIADYRLDGWTGMDALALMKENGKDVPFILVTGVLEDGIAVDCIKRGASDYILKDRLARLPMAIRSAIEEADLQKERRHTHDRMRESEEMFRTLADAIDSAIFVYLGTKCRYANREAELVTGYSHDELLSMNSLKLIHRDSRDAVVQLGFSNGQNGALHQRSEVKIVTKSGANRWLDMTSSVIEIDGRRGRLLTAFDITERKIILEETKRLATVDPLTGLANYRRLVDAFECELGRSQRTERSFSLLLLDLDSLKKINDTYGHLVGSRALCRVGNVLEAQCRSMDTAARYGGDEFAVLLPETKASAGSYLADRIAGSLLKDGEKPSISVSFGLAACPEDGNNFKEILQVADSRLYLMKDERLGRLSALGPRRNSL